MTKKSDRSAIYISKYTVQCAGCLKWRVIPTQEEYEEIGSRILDDPWFCNKKPNVTCEDPADDIYNDEPLIIWVIDKPNIPKTPDGFMKKVVVRKDCSKCDIYYYLPTGKKVRSLSDIKRFLKENPMYESMVDISDFDFGSPKVIAADVVPVDAEEDASSASKKLKTC